MSYKHFTLFLAALGAALLSVSNASASQERTLLNNDWHFALGNAADMMADFTHGTEYFTYYCKVRTTNQGHAPIMPEFDDSAWQTVSLPHDWVVDLPYSGEASHSHGYKCIGWKYPENSVGWYRKKVFVPEEWRGQQVSIEFEGVFRNSQVFCNGYYLGTELSGYSSFTYDLSAYLDYGSDNVICVRVDASTEEGWFYEGAGIYRNVWLHRSGPAAIKPYSLAIEGGRASYELQMALGADTSKVTERQTVLDADGVEVSAPAHLWSIDDPYLYTLRLELFYDGEPSAQYERKFGVRTIEFNPSDGFLLNGERVQLKGCDLHLDAAGVGVGVPDELWRYKLLELKKYGFNAIRSSHNPASPAMLDLCDELGMVVIDEQRQFATGAEQKAQMRNMIERDRNHPCVILWSVGNEEWAAEWNDHGTLIARELTELAHSIDPTRPTTYGSSGGPFPNRGVDVPGFNYVIQNDITGLLAEMQGHTGVGTEETSGCGTRGKYDTVPQEGWMRPHNRAGVENKVMGGVQLCSQDGADGTMKIHMTPDGKVLNVIERGWRYYKEHPGLGGLFYWTGTDYRGESNPMVWPATGSEFGILDYCCFPKDEAFYLQSWWIDEPVLHICGPVDGEVWVYSNFDMVELWAGGKSLGRKQMPSDSHLWWQLSEKQARELAEGKISLKAKGWRKSRAITPIRRAAAGARASGTANAGSATSMTAVWPEVIEDVALSASKSSMKADGQDVVVIEVTAPDEPLEASVEGARLLGWGNGNPGFKAVERPQPVCGSASGAGGATLTITPFSGKAQVLVRSIEGQTGRAIVKIGGRILEIEIE